MIATPLIEIIKRPSIRKAEKPDVIMSCMDYVIICQVIKRLNEIDMRDDELSFLLGKPNNYVFSFIIKPSDKNRFHEDQLDLLPFILECPFSKIFVNDTQSGNIQLYHTKNIDEDGYKGFSHIVYSPNGDGTRIIWKKKNAPKGSTRKTNKAILALLKNWIDQGYFEQKRDALEIFKKIKAQGMFKFRISDIEKCMKILCGSRQALLQKDSVDGVLRYWRNEILEKMPEISAETIHSYLAKP
ncbi:DUF2797 domain-containing protein [Sphingobacterium athyrii]|uniref:DUF2797 domain-containing protein n=1 Tax=Sphingobacterium athyrii TaxID=2152717 RepID=UPI0011B1DDB4|nr:DUF2797 domain-containing protein [Sphingobacterium athyrii]